MGAGEAGRTALATDRGGEDVWASATVALIIHTIFLELHAISNSLTDQLRECVDGASSHTSFSRQEHGTPAGLASSGDAPLLEGLQQLLAPFGANQIALPIPHGQADTGVPCRRQGLHPTLAVAPAPPAEIPDGPVRADLGVRDIPERKALLKHREPAEVNAQVFATDRGLKPAEEDHGGQQDQQHAGDESIDPPGEVWYLMEHHQLMVNHESRTILGCCSRSRKTCSR